MNKMLLIVDPQYDFIDGSLAVPGAVDAMDRLSQYIVEHGNEYACKVITVDWHPYDHCSFAGNGGEWPEHCVRYSKGAAVWSNVLSAVNDTEGKVTILTKGTDPDKEEYSIFQNEKSRQRLIDMIVTEHIDQIDICGIAGDICVLSTLSDGVKLFGRNLFNILYDFAPSLDGGQKLRDFV